MQTLQALLQVPTQARADAALRETHGRKAESANRSFAAELARHRPKAEHSKHPGRAESKKHHKTEERDDVAPPSAPKSSEAHHAHGSEDCIEHRDADQDAQVRESSSEFSNSPDDVTSSSDENVSAHPDGSAAVSSQIAPESETSAALTQANSSAENQPQIQSEAQTIKPQIEVAVDSQSAATQANAGSEQSVATQVRQVDDSQQSTGQTQPQQHDVQTKPNASTEIPSDAIANQSRHLAANEQSQRSAKTPVAANAPDPTRDLTQVSNSPATADADTQQDPPPTQSQQGGRRESHDLRSNGQNPQQIPAAARALQVEAGVNLENATGQVPNSVAPIAPSLSASQNPHLNAHVAVPNHSTETAASNLHGQQNWDDVPLSRQVVRGLSAMVNQRGGVMNMRLDPPELGQLRIQMSLARGVVTADFHASSPQAQNLLEKNLAALRGTLEGQGLTVERLGVHVMSNQGQQSMGDDARQQQGTAHREQHNAAGGESRGRREQSPDQQRRHFAGSFTSVLDGLST